MSALRFRVLHRTRSRLSIRIAENENWYHCSDADRQTILSQLTECIEILVRAGRRNERSSNRNTARELFGIAEKLSRCQKNRRCNSLACPRCRHAHQLAKSAGQAKLLSELAARGYGRPVMGTLVPVNLRFTAEDIADVNLDTIVRRFKDNLARHDFSQPLVGHVDISWEREGYFQVHFHTGLVTTDSAALTNSLKAAFPRNRPRSRPVHFKKAWDLEFVPYVNKVVHTAALLRSARRKLPGILVMLDRNDPMDGLVLRGIRLSTEDGNLLFKPIKSIFEDRMEKSGCLRG